MKKMLAFLLVLAMALSLGACAGPEEIPSQANEGGESFSPVYPYAAVPIYNARHEKIGELEQSGKIFPTESGFVYTKRAGNREAMEYYQYTASTGENVKIGSVQDWFIQSDQSVLLQNHLFFFVVTATDDGNVLRLMDLDLENHTMSEVYAEEGGDYYTPMAAMGDRIFIAKPMENGSCIQEYDPSSKKMKTLKSFSFDSAKNVGEMVKYLYADGDTLSVLMLEAEEIKTEEGGAIIEPFARLRVDVYDKDMKLLESRDISDVSDEDDERLKTVTSFLYSDGLLYYQNNSSTQFFGRVGDRSLIMLMFPDNSLRMARETALVSGTKLLYSLDEGNTLYRMDMKTGDMREGSFSADDESYTIHGIYRGTGGNVWIRMGSREPLTDEKRERLYYVSESDLKFSD